MRKVVKLPKNLNINFLTSIINNLNFVFKLEKKNKKDFHLILTYIEKIDLAGILILFKFLEYSISQECFDEPILYGGEEGNISKAISLYGFQNLYKEYVKNRAPLKELQNLKIIKEESFLIAPHTLLRGKYKTKKEFDIKITEALNKFYGPSSTDIISTILNCAAEISSNFYNHAQLDSKTIILAKGTNNCFEIACADTAIGIPSSLKTLEKYNNKTNIELLKIAFEQEVTSKPNSFHMGYGLWMIHEVIKQSGGILEVYSEDVRYSIKNKKEKVSKCPYWKGSFIYMKLPIKSGINIADILKSKRKNIGFDISINFT